MSTFQICEKWAKSFKISVIFEKIFEILCNLTSTFSIFRNFFKWQGAHFDFSVKYKAMRRDTLRCGCDRRSWLFWVFSCTVFVWARG